MVIDLLVYMYVCPLLGYWLLLTSDFTLVFLADSSAIAGASFDLTRCHRRGAGQDHGVPKLFRLLLLCPWRPGEARCVSATPYTA